MKPHTPTTTLDERDIVLIECMQQLQQLCADVEVYYNSHQELGPVIACHYRQICEHTGQVAYHLSEIVRVSLFTSCYQDGECEHKKPSKST